MAWILMLLIVICIGVLCWAVMLQRQAAALRAEAGQLRAADQSIDDLIGQVVVEGTKNQATVDADLDPVTEPRTLICIEILNPLELAAKESWFADKFGSLSPALIKKLVHSQAVKITHEHLAAHGAHAQVKIHRA